MAGCYSITVVRIEGEEDNDSLSDLEMEQWWRCENGEDRSNFGFFKERKSEKCGEDM